SGEYAMIKFAGKSGALDPEKAMMEVLTSIKRSGADLIFTYFAEEFALIS
ncbi:MAG: porphobilinogen synthase, partial [Pseudobdellovibrionaceae bacterium]